MGVSYNRLWKLLIDKKMSASDIRKAAEIAPNTMTKLRRDEAVNLASQGEYAAYWAVTMAILWSMQTKPRRRTFEVNTVTNGIFYDCKLANSN